MADHPSYEPLIRLLNRLERLRTAEKRRRRARSVKEARRRLQAILDAESLGA